MLVTFMVARPVSEMAWTMLALLASNSAVVRGRASDIISWRDGVKTSKMKRSAEFPFEMRYY